MPQYSVSAGPSIFLSRADLCREVVREEMCQNALLPWEPRPREERAASANCHSSLTSAANPAARNHPMELQPHPAQVRAACKPREHGGAGLSFSPASPCCHGLPGDKKSEFMAPASLQPLSPCSRTCACTFGLKSKAAARCCIGPALLPGLAWLYLLPIK